MLKHVWWQWLLACIAAKLLQVVLDGVAGWAALVAVPGQRELAIFLGFLVIFRLFSGALGGFAQWLVLKQWLPAIRYWVPATSVGGAIAFCLMQWLWSRNQLPPNPGMLGTLIPPQSAIPEFVLAGIYGLILGLAQWLVLRTKLPQAAGWLLASSFGTMLTSILFERLEELLGLILGPAGWDVSRGPWNPFYWGVSALSTIAYAALTGAFLFWRPRPMDHSPPDNLP